MNTFSRRNQGSALITALLVTAIAAMIATLLLVKTTAFIKQTEIVFNRDRGALYLEGIQAWARDLLIREAYQRQNFPQTMPLTTVGGVQLNATLQDAMGLFNINCMSNTYHQRQFVRLLAAVAPEVSTQQANKIAIAITDWLSPSNADELYLRQQPPYRASHQLMTDISELRLVDGITPRIYQQIAPYVTALPLTQAKLNINSAPWPVLFTIAENLSPEQAKKLVSCRAQQGGFEQASDFQNVCGAKSQIKWDPGMTLLTSSNYFLLQAYAKVGEQQLTLKNLMLRDIINEGKGAYVKVRILWQSEG